MKSLFLIVAVSITAIVFIMANAVPDGRVVNGFEPEPKSSSVQHPESQDAELVVAAYIKAAQGNYETAMLCFIADLETLPHRQPREDSQPQPEANFDNKRAGKRLGVIDEIGHEALFKEDPEYIRNLRLQVERMESKCKPPGNCRVRVFFENFENREIVRDYIVYQIDGIGWRIVSVLSAIDW